MDHRDDQAFALRLRGPAPGADPARLAGEIEHVRSGERRAFADGDELLAGLRQLCALAAQRAARTAPGHG